MIRKTLTVLTAGMIGLSALAAPTQAVNPASAVPAQSVGSHYNSGVYAYGLTPGICRQAVCVMQGDGWHPVSGMQRCYVPELGGPGFIVYMDM